MDEQKQFALSIWYGEEYDERYGRAGCWETWATLAEAEAHAKALRRQGAKVTIYQEM